MQGFGVDPSQTNPFFNSADLTDEQLSVKLSELNKKISAAMAAGVSYDVLDQLLALRDMLQRDYTERAVMKYNNNSKDEFDGLIG